MRRSHMGNFGEMDTGYGLRNDCKDRSGRCERIQLHRLVDVPRDQRHPQIGCRDRERRLHVRPRGARGGRVDAWMGFVTNEPTVLELSGFPVHTFLLAEFGYEVYADIYETTSAAIRDHKDLLVEFLRAEREGWAADITSPSAGLATTMSLYGKKLGLSAKQQGLENSAQLKLIRTPFTEKHGLLSMNADDISKNLATLELASSKKIGNYYTKADLFDDTVLKAL